MKRLLLPACFLLHCSATPSVPQPAAPTVPSPAPTVSPTPSAAPAASSAPKPQTVPTASASSAAPAAKPPRTPRLPLPPAPAGADKEKFSFAASVCSVAIKREKGKALVGCRSCPPFEGVEALPDGKVVENPDSFFPLETVVRGSFTSAGAKQAALVFEGCEPHAANYGGTLLVEQAADGWNSLHYAAAFHPRECKTLRRSDGRDILVCRYLDAHQTTGTDTIWAFDFAAASPDDPEKGWQVIVGLSDNSFGVCMGVPPWGIEASSVVSYTARDVNGDGEQDVSVQIRRASVPYSKALEDKLKKACEKAIQANPDGFPSVKPSTFMPAAATITLDFVYDGTKFSATAGTKARMGAWPKPE